ncbi:MAG TPA: NlpC/P60 family protein [Mycobacteriales bacterium]|nr:NlpC/P60 family protein [Mycobacteriales bacterium]
MLRRTRSITTAIALLAAGLPVAFASHASADPLATARARAAALQKLVDRLNTQAEVIIERYDATEAELNVAVARRGQADQAVTAIQASANNAEQTVASHAQALYESGGDPAVLASLLNGTNPTQAIDRYRLAGDVLAYENRVAQSAEATLAHARVLAREDSAISTRITRLEGARQADATKVEGLLDSEQQALAHATSTVREILRADQAAAAAAGAASFDSALTGAGGTLGGSTPPNATAAAAIAAARSRIGDPYVWGATGPNSFDCSGLTQWSYHQAGINLPRTSREQWYAGPHPTLAQLEPGDLLFFALNTSDPATIHHVTIYIGKGLMIAAPETGEDVQIQPVYMQGYIGAVRPWLPPGTVLS